MKTSLGASGKAMTGKTFRVLRYYFTIVMLMILFRSENDALLFFNYINSGHHNIRLTMDKEIDHKISFLDVLINNDTHFPVTSF